MITCSFPAYLQLLPGQSMIRGVLRRSVVERLSVPGVRRLFIIEPETRTVEGIVSLSDVAAYLFDVL